MPVPEKPAWEDLEMSHEADRTIAHLGAPPEETDEMPVVPYRVLYTDLPVYSDAACRKRISDAHIAVLLPLDPDDQILELDVVPTRASYQPGQIITWDLNNKRTWEAGWYRNPDSGQVEKAWTMHVEFTGKLIQPKTLEENRAKLADLERRMAPVAAAAGVGQHSSTRIN